MSDMYGEKTFQEVVDELQQLNPKANIQTIPQGNGIISNRPATKLNKPYDFYVTRNGGLSNLGHTESGNYVSIAVEVTSAELAAPKTKLRFLDRVKLGLLKLKTQSPVASEPDREM